MELVTSTQKSEKTECPALHNTMKPSTETTDWAQSRLTYCFFLPLCFKYTLKMPFLNLCQSWNKKHWFTDTRSCRTRGYQMWKNVKWPLTFSAPTRRTTADSINKTPDTIIRELTAVVPGTYIERNVRLALTCDYSALQKNSKLQNGDKFLFYLTIAYSYSTHVRTADWQNVACSLPSSFRHMWIDFWGYQTVWVSVCRMNIMMVLNIHKHSFQLTAFSNFSVAHEYRFHSGVVSTFIISSTILYSNVAWTNMQHFSGQYFGWM